MSCGSSCHALPEGKTRRRPGIGWTHRKFKAHFCARPQGCQAARLSAPAYGDEFFKGKTIRFFVGFSPGGGEVSGTSEKCSN